MIELYLVNFFGGSKWCDKMAISAAYILKIAEKYPFLRLQMRANTRLPSFIYFTAPFNLKCK